MQGGPCKVVLLGEAGVGKTCLSTCFITGKTNLETESTIGASFAVKELIVKGQTIKMHIWDTAGQERFRSLSKMYYHNAKVAVLVYDITVEHSFLSLQSWYEELKNAAPKDIGRF